MIVLVLALALFTLGVSGIVFVIVVATQRSSLQGSPSPDAPIVGIWMGEKGNVLQLRSDGTARSRTSSGSKIGYLEWNLDESNELRLYHMVPSKSAAWKSRLQNWVAGNNRPDDRYDVIEMSPAGFTLRATMGPAKGDVFTFSRATDAELKVAP
jgi:hypothetical protein